MPLLIALLSFRLLNDIQIITTLDFIKPGTVLLFTAFPWQHTYVYVLVFDERRHVISYWVGILKGHVESVKKNAFKC